MKRRKKEHNLKWWQGHDWLRIGLSVAQMLVSAAMLVMVLARIHG